MRFRIPPGDGGIRTCSGFLLCGFRRPLRRSPILRGIPRLFHLVDFFSAPHAHMRKMSAKRPQTKLLRALYKHLSSLDGLCIFNLFGLPGRFKRCSDIRSLEHLRYLKAPLPPLYITYEDMSIINLPKLTEVSFRSAFVFGICCSLRLMK